MTAPGCAYGDIYQMELCLACSSIDPPTNRSCGGHIQEYGAKMTCEDETFNITCCESCQMIKNNDDESK